MTRGRSPIAVAGLAIVAFLALLAVGAPHALPGSPTAITSAHALKPPTLGEPFGMDDLGRSVLSRVVHGYRVSLGVALAVVYVPIIARVVRAAVLATKAEVYVEGARAVGAAAPRLVLRHIVPNCVTPLLVQASVLMAIAILVEAALSFLGVGVRPPTPSLGLMLSDGRGFMLQAPWVVVFPGLAILAAVLGFNMLADGLRDWLDPQQAGRG